MEQEGLMRSAPATGGYDLPDPLTLPEEGVRPPIVVNEILRKDAVPPPANLLEDPHNTLGLSLIHISAEIEHIAHAHDFAVIQGASVDLGGEDGAHQIVARIVPPLGNVDVYKRQPLNVPLPK